MAEKVAPNSNFLIYTDVVTVAEKETKLENKLKRFCTNDVHEFPVRWPFGGFDHDGKVE
jgi:cupin superfamily acireductone dioxygenase involved in methionine salvage